jgi:hypothetical protein
MAKEAKEEYSRLSRNLPQQLCQLCDVEKKTAEEEAEEDLEEGCKDKEKVRRQPIKMFLNENVNTCVSGFFFVILTNSVFKRLGAAPSRPSLLPSCPLGLSSSRPSPVPIAPLSNFFLGLRRILFNTRM